MPLAPPRAARRPTLRYDLRGVTVLASSSLYPFSPPPCVMVGTGGLPAVAFAVAAGPAAVRPGGAWARRGAALSRGGRALSTTPPPPPLPPRAPTMVTSPVTTIERDTPPPASPPPAVTALAAKLQTELPALFTPGTDPDWSIYTDDVLFEDPLNRFRGVRKYRANIGFLKDSFAFRNSAMFLHDTVAEEDAVVTRWTLAMTAAFLPWAPRVVFTGESIYGVDVSPGGGGDGGGGGSGGGGGVNRHVDTWDSITAQGFPSLEAVADLVGQLSPAGAAVARGGSGGDAPPGVPPYLTLRRAAAWEVRRVDAHDVVAAAAAWAPGGGGGSTRPPWPPCAPRGRPPRRPTRRACRCW
ncbi:hypothetical protein BU14_0532s0018 [Porphyra umbilicalis]|uniref:Uncharacterized protein n=1 Tax=Porphyra umbilicalis TaxID=2786 RepID=A0A1X6NS52_PORUM|nr:hypothetical protein BU14_0532s0018 [Porphyra umbilicalis]|eukprot:OSX71459.1 hypothetical protein BU14_0532s0018 [Porphyra umbilicalis]